MTERQGTQARISLREMFPRLTEEQLQALGSNAPLPPSPDWVPASGQVFAADNEQPSLACVSCILVTNQTKRLALAKRAVNQFVQQSYTNKQIVVVNATDHPVTNVAHPDVTEIRLDPASKPTIGQMRNVGLANARGSWVKQWDDDDLYHPMLLAYQMAHRVRGQAQLLTSQIRVDINRSTVYMHRNGAGIYNTILFPLSSNLRYPESNLGEDGVFWMNHFISRTNVLNNDAAPACMLSTAIYHGFNLTQHGQFMVGHDQADTAGAWAVGEEVTAYLKKALPQFGLKVDKKTGE